MQFSLSDEQTLLRDSAAAFVRDHSSLRRIRALRDSRDADGFSRDLWRDIAALGWLGIPFADYAQGGLFPIAYTVGTDFKKARRLPAEQLTHWNHW